jgi:uncharacterized protein
MPLFVRGPISLQRLAAASLLLLYAAFAALAQTFPKPSGHINDFAGVLSAPAKQQLENLAIELRQKTGAQVAVAIVQSLEGDTVENYANLLAEQWGVGDQQDRGILLLLAVQDRRIRLEVGYGLEPVLPDGRVGEILESATPALRSGDYDNAVAGIVAQTARVIAEDAGAQLSGIPRQAPVSRGRRRGLPGGWLTLLLILPFLLSPRRRRYGGWRDNVVTTAWMLGGLGRGPGGGRGSLGQGGFRGFGGGGFGGGGASRSW